MLVIRCVFMNPYWAAPEYRTALFPAFIEPVQAFLASAPEAQGSAALQGTLADPRTWRITGDDKALLLALWQ